MVPEEHLQPNLMFRSNTGPYSCGDPQRVDTLLFLKTSDSAGKTL
jgi:hypothetical protein